MDAKPFSVKTAVICDTEPIAIEGLRLLLDALEDMQVIATETSLTAGMELTRKFVSSVVIIDKAFGIHAAMDWARNLRPYGTAPVLWGKDISQGEALRLLQAGCLGVVRKSAPLESLVACIRSAAQGIAWVEGCLVSSSMPVRNERGSLTGRELQVLELVEQGLRNKDIANALGIQAGTVKIHLKHIFEKTGTRGRYHLALSGLKEKGMLALPTM